MTSSTLQGGSHKVDFGFLGIHLKSVKNDELPKKIPKSAYQEKNEKQIADTHF